jgi:outer membrane biosynthesis protein TonB
MMLKGRGVFRLAGLALLVLAAPASAQDVRDRGKTAQQIFASDCALCHKSPQGLAKAGGLFGLDSFLREHYTASRETAGLLARYLEGAGEAPAPDQRRQQRRTAKPSDAKPSDAKPADAKPAAAKPDEAKSSDTKPASEPKPEPKAEVKPEAKPEPKAAVEPKADSKAETEIKSGIAVSPASADKPKSE